MSQNKIKRFIKTMKEELVKKGINMEFIPLDEHYIILLKAFKTKFLMLFKPFTLNNNEGYMVHIFNRKDRLAAGVFINKTIYNGSKWKENSCDWTQRILKSLKHGTKLSDKKLINEIKSRR